MERESFWTDTMGAELDLGVQCSIDSSFWLGS